MRQLVYFLASGFGSGYVPKIPGTAGSFVGLILTYFLLDWGLGYLFLTFLATTVIGWLLCLIVLKSEDHTDPDPSFIVIDEIAGMMLTVFLIYLGVDFFIGFEEGFSSDFKWFNPWEMIILINAFWAFRLFDILKPYPINRIDRKMALYPSLQPLGIMLDDLVAAVYASILVIPILIYSS